MAAAPALEGPVPGNGAGPADASLDTDTTIVAIRDEVAQQLGYAPADLVGRPLSVLLPTESLGDVGAALVRLVDGTVSSSSASQPLLHAAGEWLSTTLTATLRRDPAGGVAGFDLRIARTDHVAIDPGLAAQLPRELRAAPVPAALVAVDGVVVGANQAWGDLFGPALSTPGVALSVIATDDEAAAQLAALLAAAPAVTPIDVRCQGAQGPLWCRFRTLDASSESRILITAEDVTSDRLAIRVLAANEQLFRTVAEGSPVGMARLTDDLSISYSNPAWSQTVGRRPEPGWALGDLLDPSDADATLGAVRERLAAADPAPVHGRLAGPGQRRVMMRVVPAAPPLGGAVVSIDDITDSAARSESASRLSDLIETTTDLVAVLDLRNEELSYLNRAGRALIGADEPGEGIGLEALVADFEMERFENEVMPVLAAGQVWTGDLSMRRRDGALVRVMQSLAPELDASGRLVRISALGRDVTAQRRNEEEMAYRATHDSLTGLPNRSLLLDHLELALARATREHTPVAVLFLDLDRFKAVNDTLGHDTGDEVLRQVAERVSAVLRPSDTVARLGGDEFVVLCEEIDGERDAVAIADRVATAITEAPFTLGDQQLELTTSIGIALSEDGGDAAALLAEADNAMYLAKRAGRARNELFDEALRSRDRARQELGSELAAALAADQISCAYQPVFDLVTGRVVAAEALVRWQHPTRGQLSPAEFLTVAAELHLDGDVDRVVLQQACRQARRWRDALGPTSPVVSVNLSPNSLRDRTLTETVLDALDRAGTPAELLRLEIPEDVLGRSRADELADLGPLVRRGVGLALDDFGTAGSSLPHLASLSLTEAKLDARLTADPNEPHNRNILVALVALAGALGLGVVAKRVERRDVLEALRALGFGAVQGRVFSGPTPAPEADRWLGRAARRSVDAP